MWVTVFLRRRDSRKHGSLLDDMRQRRITHALKFITENNAFTFEANLGADVLRHQFVITRQNLDLDTIAFQCAQGELRTFEWRIRES